MAGPMLGGGRGRTRHRPVGEINVTPFVDVMLVLLVVFMVTAPMITQGVQISLPEVKNDPMTDQKEPIEISIKATGDVFLQTQKVPFEELDTRLKAIQKVRGATAVLINADKRVDYGHVMKVMSSLQSVGLVDVGLVTAPMKGN